MEVGLEWDRASSIAGLEWDHASSIAGLEWDRASGQLVVTVPPCSEWLREAQEYCDSEFVVFLVACKRDLVVSWSYNASASYTYTYISTATLTTVSFSHVTSAVIVYWRPFHSWHAFVMYKYINHNICTNPTFDHMMYTISHMTWDVPQSCIVFFHSLFQCSSPAC